VKIPGKSHVKDGQLEQASTHKRELSQACLF
jgi:hypothetical protein